MMTTDANADRLLATLAVASRSCERCEMPISTKALRQARLHGEPEPTLCYLCRQEDSRRAYWVRRRERRAAERAAQGL